MPMESELDERLPTAVRKDLAAFRDSVHAEMVYLRDKGGRKYRIVNGERVGREKTHPVYSFSIEAEVFLSDDAPVRVEVDGQSIRGFVLECSDFQITLLLERDIGEKVSTAFVSADPWKLLQFLNDRIKALNPQDHPIAVRLMEDGPKIATLRPISEVSTGQDAAKHHVRDNPITLIWGPPGTGKTHVMAEIAISYILAGKSILAVSHSNVSVDGIVLKVAELMRARNLDKLIHNEKVLRFGHVRNEELDAEEDLVAHNYALSCNPDLKEELDDLLKKRIEIKKSNARNSAELLGIQKRITAIRKAVDEDEKQAVLRARMVATTASKMYANKLFEGRKYDVVMFDEVSMAFVPQIICAAMHAESRLVLVGDFRQLSPIASAPGPKAVLSKDIFSYLQITDSKQEAHYHRWLVMLNEQRRMHPAISAFPSISFYNQLLLDHESVIHARDKIVAAEPCHNKPMNLVNLRGTYCPSARNVDNSRFNILGALISFGLALEAQRSGKVSVGVIAPYIAQVRLVRAMIQDHAHSLRGKKRAEFEISCSTVHQFQGSERDVIVLDTVESYPAKHPGILTHKNVNGSVDRLVNVAITRARGKILTVANESFWDERHAGKNNAFGALCKHHRCFDNVLTTRNGSLSRLLNSLSFGSNIELYDTIDAKDTFLKDIEKAGKRIVFSFPDGKLTEPFASQLYQAIRKARARKVEVLAKCINYKELPEDWKTFTWQSDDAVFPLTVIDGSVCWYGMPPSRLRPPTKDDLAPLTTLATPFRITGQKTVSMIWSLAELEQRRSDGTTQSLAERRGTRGEDDDGKAVYGLAGYVKEKEKCPDCHGPVIMKKSRKRRGANYLWCPKCEAPHFLSRDTVNHYLSIRLVRCEKCGSSMTAMLGRYGLFISCDRNRQHTYNPDQI